MGRKNRLPTTYDLFVVGEQLRIQMTNVGLVKDNRYHFRKHRQSFVAKDVIDWVVRMHHVDSRQEAIAAMSVLQEFSVIHHVSDDQDFKDRNTLFRFARDDSSYKADRELKTFYRGLEIYNKLAQKGKDVIRNIYHKGDLHSNVFYGYDLVDFLLEWESECNREVVVEEMKDLLARDVISHITDDCHFMDDQVAYKFNVDFHKNCLLIDVLDILDSFTSAATSRIKEIPLLKTAAQQAHESSDDEDDKKDEPALKQRFIGLPLPQIELYDEHIKLAISDNVGFGLVLRGTAPCFVHRIDPLGPAAKANIKVGQAITSVNGKTVSNLTHKSVGLMIAQWEGSKIPLKLGVSDMGKRNTRKPS